MLIAACRLDQVGLAYRDVARILNFPEDVFAVKSVDRELSRPYLDSARILDVGGASGIDAIPMSSIAKSVVVLDLNLNGLVLGKRLACELSCGEKVHFVFASGEKLPFTEASFNLLTCFSALDHFPNATSVAASIREFRRILVLGGHAIITVPNMLCLPVTVLTAVKRRLREVSEVHRFTPKELYFLLESNHLTPIRYASASPTEIKGPLMRYLLPSGAQMLTRDKVAKVFVSCLFRITRSLFASVFLRPRFGIVGINNSTKVIIPERSKNLFRL